MAWKLRAEIAAGCANPLMPQVLKRAVALEGGNFRTCESSLMIQGIGCRVARIA